MRDVKSKIASPENPRILTCDVVLPNERYKDRHQKLPQTEHKRAKKKKKNADVSSVWRNRNVCMVVTVTERSIHLLLFRGLLHATAPIYVQVTYLLLQDATASPPAKKYK